MRRPGERPGEIAGPRAGGPGEVGIARIKTGHRVEQQRAVFGGLGERAGLVKRDAKAMMPKREHTP